MKVLTNPDHFYVLVCFGGQIGDPAIAPAVWVVPAKKVSAFIRHYKGRSVVSRMLMKTYGKKFDDAWGQIASVSEQ
jgi:hypothetical protein